MIVRSKSLVLCISKSIVFRSPTVADLHAHPTYTVRHACFILKANVYIEVSEIQVDRIGYQLLLIFQYELNITLAKIIRIVETTSQLTSLHYIITPI